MHKVSHEPTKAESGILKPLTDHRYFPAVALLLGVYWIDLLVITATSLTH